MWRMSDGDIHANEGGRIATLSSWKWCELWTALRGDSGSKRRRTRLRLKRCTWRHQWIVEERNLWFWEKAKPDRFAGHESSRWMKQQIHAKMLTPYIFGPWGFARYDYDKQSLGFSLNVKHNWLNSSELERYERVSTLRALKGHNDRPL